MNEIFDLINVTGVALEILIAVSFFNTVSNKKQLSSYYEIVFNIVFVVVQSVVIVTVSQQIVVSVVLLLLLFLISLRYNLTRIKRIMFLLLLMILFALSEIFTGLILSMISNVSVEQLSSNVLYYMQGVLESKLIMFVILKIVGYFSVKSEVKVPRHVFFPLTALPLATFLVAYVMSEYMFQSEPNILLMLSTIAIIFLIVSNILVFYLFEYQLKITEGKNQEQMIKQQLEYKAEYYKELSKRQQITNKTMHDLKNQLFALQEIYRKDPVEGIERIDIICEDILNSYTLKFTGIEAVDALITSKLTTMKENHIEFSNSIYISDENCMDTVDLCVVLGNLLDNAIEANMDVDEKNRFIHLLMVQRLDYLSINISNSKNKVVKGIEAEISTTKKHKEVHGFGLKSVKEIVKKYDGNCTFRQEENKFEVIILLKNK